MSVPRRVLVITLAVLAAITGLAVAAAPAAQAKAASPGSLTGYAFDTCTAPSQQVMDAWRVESPYSGIGIYIGGSNRKCSQPELTPGWVKTQVKRDWHLLALYVGPQASCANYPDVMSSDITTANDQGRAQAAAAVDAARGLGIGSGSTLYYDLEDYDIGSDACRRSALSFLSGWTDGLHGAGYDSGVYSNLAAAITSLDLADRVSAGSYSMPDDIWFAFANGQADTVTDDRVLSSRWDDHARVHQYAIDAPQTYGGFAMTVDANWVDVGRGSVAPREKQLCRGVDLDLRRYPELRTGSRGPGVEALQCLLRHQHLTKAPITGRFDVRTASAVRAGQQRLGLTPTGRVTRPLWTALLARGGQPLLKVGATGDPVVRLQRALTAALGHRTKVDGVFSTKTATYVTKYQRSHRLPRTGVVTSAVWDLLLQR